MTNLAATLAEVEPATTDPSLAGTEYLDGWGVFACPFDSGHVLALRVFPRSPFGPYATVWHRTPDGQWTIYADAPDVAVACPRYFGAAAERVERAVVSTWWPHATTLRVEMVAGPAADRGGDADRESTAESSTGAVRGSAVGRVDAVDDHDLSWTVELAEPPTVRLLNAFGSRLPEAVARRRPVLAAMEWFADAGLGLGDVTLAGPVPNGQHATILPRRLYPVVGGAAVLDGADLGRPAATGATPTIGDFRLPKRPMFAVGRAYMTVRDGEREGDGSGSDEREGDGSGSDEREGRRLTDEEALSTHADTSGR